MGDTAINNTVGMSSREIYGRKKNILKDKLILYRRKPDVMNEELLGIKQNIYQRVAFRSLFNKNYSVWVWSRGLGKSWAAGLAAFDFALLYPGTTVGIAAPSFRQAKFIIENKILGDLSKRSPMLKQEIKKFSNNVDMMQLELYNGSKIIAFPVGVDGSKVRGLRLDFSIIDEYAQMDKTIVDRVIRPMLAVKTGYEVGKTDYSDDTESKMLFTSSAYFKFNHLYDTVRSYCRAIKEGSKDHFVYILNYLVGIDVGLYSEDFIENERMSQTALDFDMEYGSRFVDLGENNWVSPVGLEHCSTETDIELTGDDKSKYVAGLDVARVSGNDNTCMKVLKLIPNKDHYIKKEVYTLTMNGKTFGEQNYEIRNVLNRFPIERLYMDTTGIGVGLADEMAKPYVNPYTDEVEPALCDVNNKEHLEEISDGNFIIHGQKFSLNFNYRLAVSVKSNVEKRRLRLYKKEVEGAYPDSLSLEELKQIEEAERTRIEVMSIQGTPKGNSISFDVPKGGLSEGRKDRWTALSLALFGADEMEEEEFRREEMAMFPLIAFSDRSIY